MCVCVCVCQRYVARALSCFPAYTRYAALHPRVATARRRLFTLTCLYSLSVFNVALFRVPAICLRRSSAAMRPSRKALSSADSSFATSVCFAPPNPSPPPSPAPAPSSAAACSASTLRQEVSSSVKRAMSFVRRLCWSRSTAFFGLSFIGFGIGSPWQHARTRLSKSLDTSITEGGEGGGRGEVEDGASGREMEYGSVCVYVCDIGASVRNEREEKRTENAQTRQSPRRRCGGGEGRGAQLAPLASSLSAHPPVLRDAQTEEMGGGVERREVELTHKRLYTHAHNACPHQLTHAAHHHARAHTTLAHTPHTPHKASTPTHVCCG